MAPAVRVQPPRPEVGRQLAVLDPPAELGGPSTTELGARPALRQRAVEEHRQPELLGEQVGEDQRLSAGRAAIVGLEVDDRATSTAPTRGWSPWCPRRSTCATASRAPPTTVRASSPGRPATVNTLR